MVGRVIQTEPAIIGGGVVARPFTRAGRLYKTNEELSAEFINSIRRATRRTLIETGFIRVWPAHAVSADSADAEISRLRLRVAELEARLATPTPGTERFVMIAGRGVFNVVEGRKINDKPLPRQEAAVLAGREPATSKVEPGEPAESGDEIFSC